MVDLEYTCGSIVDVHETTTLMTITPSTVMLSEAAPRGSVKFNAIAL
jgi:hypothetical protein